MMHKSALFTLLFFINSIGYAETQKIINVDALLMPTENEFVLGKVMKHPIDQPALSRTPIFIVGTDAISLQWLKSHEGYLKNIHAIGLVAKTLSVTELKEFKSKTDLPLISANIAGFSDLIGTNHYPVLIYNNEVEQ